MNRPRVLIIDDDAEMVRLVQEEFDREGLEAVPARSGPEGLRVLREHPVEVIVTDLRMPDTDGMEILRAATTAQPGAKVIMITAFGSIASAIGAMRAGAFDYLSKPFEIEELTLVVRKALEDSWLRHENILLRGEVERRYQFGNLIGASKAMAAVFDVIKRVAGTDMSVLVTGESGTGKELVAKAIHYNSTRRGSRFVPINCAGIPEALLESELFGHVRGAFTGATDHKTGLFEAADGGTLFLDEVGELPLAVQAKLLRVLELGEVHRVGSLQPKQVDVRIVAATNRDLTVEAAEGRFRSDLLYRLNVLQLELPPLRERLEDIPYLVAAFVETFAARFQKQIGGVTPAAERLLARQRWLGNVRELRNVVERACILAEGSLLHELDIQTALPAGETVPVVAPVAPAAGPPRGMNALQEVEWQHIERALRETGGNKAAAARRLGVSRRLLYRRLERYGARGA
jgi:DNA-binding NtrC family response regulator